MTALSLTQPWATAIAVGVKCIETRSWTTRYRGPLLIHAAKTFPPEAQGFAAVERAVGRLPFRHLPLGALLAVVRLVDVRLTEDVAPEISAVERLYGDYTPGRFAWILEDAQMLDWPVPAKGALGLWEWKSPVLNPWTLRGML